MIDDGETSVQAAIRELREETGLTVTKIIAEFPGGYSDFPRFFGPVRRADPAAPRLLLSGGDSGPGCLLCLHLHN